MRQQSGLRRRNPGPVDSFAKNFLRRAATRTSPHLLRTLGRSVQPILTDSGFPENPEPNHCRKRTRGVPADVPRSGQILDSLRYFGDKRIKCERAARFGRGHQEGVEVKLPAVGADGDVGPAHGGSPLLIAPPRVCCASLHLNGWRMERVRRTSYRVEPVGARPPHVRPMHLPSMVGAVSPHRPADSGAPDAPAQRSGSPDWYPGGADGPRHGHGGTLQRDVPYPRPGGDPGRTRRQRSQRNGLVCRPRPVRPPRQSQPCGRTFGHLPSHGTFRNAQGPKRPCLRSLHPEFRILHCAGTGPPIRNPGECRRYH